MNYHEFWDELSPYYPLSKGELRLPIMNQILDSKDFLPENFFVECENILKNILLSAWEKNLQKIAKNEWEWKISQFFEKNFTGVVRFDCMLNHENKPKIIEINADYPDGLLLHDASFSVLSQGKNFLHHDLFLKFFDKNKNIFVVFPKNAFFQDAYFSDFLALQNAGFNVFYGNYDELECMENKIFYKNIEIHTIRRCVEVSKMSDADFSLLHGAEVDFINTFDLRTIGYKSALSEIHHNFIPKSFTLTSENISNFHNKNNWVAKPSNMSEGHGIIIGADVEADFWENFLAKNTENNYILQEFVQSEKRDFSFFDDGNIVTKNVYFDFCPHFFVKNGNIIGRGHTLARFSENKILNVAQGGGIGYMI